MCCGRLEGGGKLICKGGVQSPGEVPGPGSVPGACQDRGRNKDSAPEDLAGMIISRGTHNSFIFQRREIILLVPRRKCRGQSADPLGDRLRAHLFAVVFDKLNFLLQAVRYGVLFFFHDSPHVLI